MVSIDDYELLAGLDVRCSISIFDTSLADWQRLLAVLEENNYPLEFSRGEIEPIPSCVGEIFNSRNNVSPTLTVDIGEGLDLTCFGMVEQKITLDFTPADVTTQQKAKTIAAFMRLIGDALDRPVRLTAGGMDDVPIAVYDPAAENS